MKQRRTWMAVMMAAALTIVGAGCGDKNDTSSGGAATTAPTEQAGEKAPEAKSFKIGISQIVEHPSLDATREGFIAGLKDAGLVEKENLTIDVQIAQGDSNNNTTIAQKFAGDKLDLVLGISTGSSQALVKSVKNVPILFTAVTDPLGSSLVSSLEAPGGNITGVMDTHPDEIASLMEFIAKEFPNVKTVGAVANEGEQNSAIAVQRAEEVLAKHGIKLIRAAVSNSSEVKQAAESLVGKADAIYVNKDNTVVAAFEAVVQVADKNKLPLFAGDIDSVKRGAFATFGYEYYDIGYTTGKMAADILLNGKKPADIPVSYPENLDLYMNLKAAANQGVTVTDSMKSMTDAKNILE